MRRCLRVCLAKVSFKCLSVTRWHRALFPDKWCYLAASDASSTVMNDTVHINRCPPPPPATIHLPPFSLHHTTLLLRQDGWAGRWVARARLHSLPHAFSFFFYCLCKRWTTLLCSDINVWANISAPEWRTSNICTPYLTQLLWKYEHPGLEILTLVILLTLFDETHMSDVSSEVFHLVNACVYKIK